MFIETTSRKDENIFVNVDNIAYIIPKKDGTAFIKFNSDELGLTVYESLENIIKKITNPDR